MTINNMYNSLQNGIRFQVIGRSGYGDDIQLSYDGFISWTHYGSSANKNTLEGLEFVLNTIFKLTPDDFYVVK